MTDPASSVPSRPKRSLGQNFLVDPNYQRKIIDVVRKVYDGQNVIEVGPGRGALTQHLVTLARHLILIEKDEMLASVLRARYESCPHVEVFTQDFLQFDFTAKFSGRAVVVGNLPYNISSQILIRLLEHRHFFSRLFLMFQREVARRCVEKTGSKEYGILSVWCQYNAQVKKMFDVPPTAFRPRPDVVSTVLSFELKPEPFTTRDRAFMDFVRLIFSQRRKKIANLLKKKYDLNLPGLPRELQPVLAQRAEELDPDMMKIIFEKLQIQEFCPVPLFDPEPAHLKIHHKICC